MNILKNMKNKFKYRNTNHNFNKIIFIKNYILFFDIFIFFLVFGKYNSEEIIFKLPQATTLSNGDIFVINQTGILIIDSNLTNIISKVETFQDDEQVNSDEILSKTTISRFNSEDNGYIFCLINDKIYIFNSSGQKVYKNDNKIPDLEGSYYSLVPIKKVGNIK